MQADQRTVEARRGPVRLWSVDVVTACEVQGGTVGTGIDPRVRQVWVEDAKAWFLFGKHSCGWVDIDTGIANYWGSD